MAHTIETLCIQVLANSKKWALYQIEYFLVYLFIFLIACNKPIIMESNIQEFKKDTEFKPFEPPIAYEEAKKERKKFLIN